MSANAKIRGLTIKFGADMSEFTTALRDVNSKINVTSKELRDVNKLLKFNPDSTELLSQQQTYLQQAIEQSKDKAKELEKAIEDAGKAKMPDDEINALKRELISTKEETKKLEAQMLKLNVDKVTKEFRETTRELDEINRLLKMDPGNVDLLRRKQELLTKAIKESKDKTKELWYACMEGKDINLPDEEIHKMERELVKSREETKNLEKEMIRLNVDEVTRKFKQTTEELEEINRLLKMDPGNIDLLKQKQEALTTAIKQSKDRVKELQTALKDAKDADLPDEEVDKLERELTEAKQETKNLQKEMKEFGSVASEQLRVAADKAKKAGEKIAEVGQSMTQKLTVPIVAAFTAAGKTASDYEENLNKIDTAFGSSADKVKAWAETATTQFGLSMVAATEAASGFGALAKGIGMTEGKAADVSTTLAGLSSDLSSYFNVGVDESSKALEGIFTGESEALKKFGVVMTETNLQKFAEDQGKVWKECDQTEKTMLRYKYVLEQTKDAQGDYARTSDGTANTFRTFQAELQNLAVTFGQEVLPIITPFIQSLTEIIHKFAELDPKTKEMIVKIGMFVAAAGPLLVVVGKSVVGISNIITAVTKLSGAFTAIKGVGMASSMAGLVTKIAPLVSGFGSLVAAIGPYILIAAAVVGAGYAIYKNWDSISAAAVKTGQKVQSAWTKTKDVVVQSQQQQAQIQMQQNEATLQAYKAMGNGIKQVATDTVNHQVETQRMTIEAYQQMGQSLVNVWGNIKSTSASGWNALKSAASAGVNSFQGAMSRLWSSASNIINRAQNGFQNMINRIKGLFNFSWQWPPLKLPHFSFDGKFSLNPPSVPHLRVDWYKKAMANGMILNGAQIFGQQNGRLLGGGEAGPEGIIGVNSLRDIIQSTITSAMGGTTYNGGVNINIYGAQGQDVKALAREVKKVFTAETQRREAAYA